MEICGYTCQQVNSLSILVAIKFVRDAFHGYPVLLNVKV